MSAQRRDLHGDDPPSTRAIDLGFALLMGVFVLLGIAAVIAVLVVGHQQERDNVVAGNDGGTGAGAVTVQSLCQARGPLPDPVCTPGDVDPRVTQENIEQTICVPGWTKKIRPPTSYTTPLKEQQMARYDVTAKNELDHLIPLALGGAPRNVRNLWPEVEEPRPGYHEKDRVERLMQMKVCAGEILLADARSGMATDWTQYLQEARATSMVDDFDDDGDP